MSTDDEEYAELLAALQASGTANAPRNGNGIHMSICDKAADAIKRLISERDEAREALRPFADLAGDYINDNSNIEDDLIMAGRMTHRGEEGTPPRVTFADFRRARAASSHKPAKREGE